MSDRPEEHFATMTATSTRSRRPVAGEYDPFFDTYLRQVPEGDLLELLERQRRGMLETFGGIIESDAQVVHAPYRWTIKQVLGHVIDGERVFGYRAARLATGDTTPLPSFDENAMVDGMNYQTVTLAALLDEWGHLRRANQALFARLDDEQWPRQGIASNRTVSVRALGWILLGHAEHHLLIVRKRLGR